MPARLNAVRTGIESVGKFSKLLIQVRLQHSGESLEEKQEIDIFVCNKKEYYKRGTGNRLLKRWSRSSMDRIEVS